jgi:hypothetical protein
MVLDHGGNPQVFLVDHIVHVDKLGGLLVADVAPLAGDAVALNELHPRPPPAPALAPVAPRRLAARLLR